MPFQVLRRRISKQAAAEESDPHDVKASAIIGDMLYGGTNQQARYLTT